MLSDVLRTGPEAALFLGGLLTLVGGSFTARRDQWRLRVVAAVAATVAAVLAAVGLAGGPHLLFEGTFTVDTATGVGRLVVCVGLLLVLGMAGDEVTGHPRESEMYSLLLFASAGASLLAGTTDLALLVVAFLLSSIPLYGVVGLLERPSAAEAALKTYLMGALFGILLMSGVTLLYAVTAQTAYPGLVGRLAGAPFGVVAAGAVLVAAGLLFEAGGVPGHFWVPDAAQGASATAAAFLTTVPKVGGLVALARLVELLPGDTRWAVLVGVLAVAGMTVGNLAAYGQDDPRRLLGWSTVSQVGYLLVPVAALDGSATARPALLYYLAAYAVTNVGAFAVAAAFPGLRSLADHGAAARGHRGVAAALVVLLLGLVGTPPTAVFVAKLVSASAAWDGGLPWLAVLLLVNTLVSLFYYLRWVAAVFGEPAAGPEAATERVAQWSRATTVVAAAASLLLGVGAGLVWPVVTGP